MTRGEAFPRVASTWSPSWPSSGWQLAVAQSFLCPSDVRLYFLIPFVHESILKFTNVLSPKFSLLKWILFWPVVTNHPDGRLSTVETRSAGQHFIVQADTNSCHSVYGWTMNARLSHSLSRRTEVKQTFSQFQTKKGVYIPDIWSYTSVTLQTAYHTITLPTKIIIFTKFLSASCRYLGTAHSHSVALYRVYIM